MSVVDDRTTHYNLALPNVDNILEDDVARLRSALNALDAALYPVDVLAAATVFGAPSNMNTLKKLSDALNSDPNFYTTMVSALAGKAATSHTHIIGDVTGLQAALNGKVSLTQFATDTVLGLVKVAASVGINLDGAGALTLAMASAGTLGGIRVGSGLSIDGSGILSNSQNPLLLTGGTMAGAINEAHGADIASASTINLTTATGNLVDVTGTAAIAAITLAEGAERWVRFTGILTLTHGASLVMPGAVNMTTAAGDYACFRGYAAGVVRCTSYLKASGYPVVTPPSGSLILLGQTTRSGVAQIDVEGFFDTTYDRYIVEYIGMKPATDAQDLYVQLKIAGSYPTSGYNSHLAGGTSSSTAYAGFVSPGSAIKVANNVSNVTAAIGANISLGLSMPADAATKKVVFWSGASHDGGGATSVRNAFGAGDYGTAGALTGIRMKFASGNISGTVRVYGIKNS